MGDLILSRGHAGEFPSAENTMLEQVSAVQPERQPVIVVRVEDVAAVQHAGAAIIFQVEGVRNEPP